MRLRNSFMLSIAIACLLLAGTTVKADTITIGLDMPAQSGVAGGVVAFDATVTNTSDALVFLNGDNTYVDLPLTLDNSPYYTNFPLSVAAGASTPDMLLFNIDIPSGTPAGLYTGYFDITGGADGSFQDIVGVADFTVNVESSTVIPEPSSLLLLLTGLAGLGGKLRRRLTW